MRLGSIFLKAGKDVYAGEETSIDQLFSTDIQRKMFEVREGVTKDETKLKVSLTKLGSFETFADVTVKKGKKTNSFMLLKRMDGLSKKISASDNIKKGDKIEAFFETV
jgi:hypothetical protein